MILLRKEGLQMGKMIYRMCLVVLLFIAVAGGVYYYLTFLQEDETSEKGIFVNEMDFDDEEPWAV